MHDLLQVIDSTTSCTCILNVFYCLLYQMTGRRFVLLLLSMWHGVASYSAAASGNQELPGEPGSLTEMPSPTFINN